MKKEKKEIPSAIYNFYGNLGALIHHVDTLNMSVDKDMNVQIQNLDQLQAEQPAPQTSTAELDPTPLIFLPNEQNQSSIQKALKATLSISSKKSVICRELYKKRELFNLHRQDDTTKANIINAWIKKLNLTNNFSTLFTRKDFCSYYCKE